MKRRHLVSSLLLGLALTLGLTWTLARSLDAARAAPAAELLVCPTCPYTSVQDAVDEAQAGDVIKVAAGTYTGVRQRAGITQVVYISESVTIRGGYAPSDWETYDPVANPTVLDAQGQGRVVVIAPPSEGPSTPTARTADGRSIDDGTPDTAVESINPVVELQGLRITGGNGPAGDPYPWSADGGGVYAVETPVGLKDNWIYGNTSGDYGRGGGVYVGGSRYYVYQDLYPLPGTLFAVLQANRIYGNAAGTGSGIALDAVAASMINNAVVDNQAVEGGAIAILGSTCDMWHTTVANNIGGAFTGISVWGSEWSASVSMTNTIIAGYTYAGVEVDQMSLASLNGVLWYDNGSNVADYGGSVSVSNEITGTPAFAADGYHLTETSAAVDQGLYAGIPGDLDHEVRPQGDGPDLGADELPVEPIQTLVDPGTGATLVYTDARGMTTTFYIPPAAVTRPISLCFSPLLTPTYALPTDVAFASHAFQFGACAQQPPVDIPVGGVTFPSFLTFSRDGEVPPLLRPYLPVILRSEAADDQGVRGGGKALAAPSLRMLQPVASPRTATSLDFEEPVTVTIHYSDADLLGVDEGSLILYYWTGSAWVDAATTCSPASQYVRDTVNNVLQLEICHLSEFAVGG